jgi:hypothetical protein
VSILALQIFVSLCLVAGSVVLYVHTVRARTFDHADRLALAPLDDDERPQSAPESKLEPAAPVELAPPATQAEVRP